MTWHIIPGGIWVLSLPIQVYFLNRFRKWWGYYYILILIVVFVGGNILEKFWESE